MYGFGGRKTAGIMGWRAHTARNFVVKLSLMSTAPTSDGTPSHGTPDPAAATTVSVPSAPLRWLRGGHTPVVVPHVPAARTLLQVLREDLGLTGTKEGCRSGGCGACTVVVGAPDGRGGLSLTTINSCIALAHSIAGRAVWTVEDVGTPTALHPVQSAMVDLHASQCGFCTPGVVMSLFALHHQCSTKRAGGQTCGVSRVDAVTALSGNLCRCTGYRPILDAAIRAAEAPSTPIAPQKILNLLQQESEYRLAPEAIFIQNLDPSNASAPSAQTAASPLPYLAPESLAALLDARRRWPQAQVVAGGTDVGLWITKGGQRPLQVLDVTRTAELCRIEHGENGEWLVGAAVRLKDAAQALAERWPAAAGLFHRFAGLPVRHAATLGGNVVNGSPIGDSMPLLLALGARVRLMASGGPGLPPQQRDVALDAFYTGYRSSVLRNDEVLTHIVLPPPEPAWDPTRDPLPHGAWCFADKVSKRFEDDISAVCLAMHLVFDHGVVRQVRLGVGGVAATPVRAVRTEAELVDRPWTEDSIRRAAHTLASEFQPLSDLRASADYRRQALAGLLQRAWWLTTGHPACRLVDLEHDTQPLPSPPS